MERLMSHWAYFWIFVAWEGASLLLIDGAAFWDGLHLNFATALKAQLLRLVMGAATFVLFGFFKCSDRFWASIEQA